MNRRCTYCGAVDGDSAPSDKRVELRPYGPGGALVCFGCATSTPEREAQAGNAYGAILDAAIAMSPHEAAVIGDGAGNPQPFTGRHPG